MLLYTSILEKKKLQILSEYMVEFHKVLKFKSKNNFNKQCTIFVIILYIVQLK